METRTEQHVQKSDKSGKTEQHTVTETHRPEPPRRTVIEVPVAPEKVEQRFKLKEIIIFLLVLALGMAAAWGINQASKDNKDEDAVAPEETIELPEYGTPEAATPTPNQSAPDTTTPSPRTDGNDNTITTPPYQSPAPAQPVVYKDATFGYTFTLPLGWAQAVEESTAQETVFYDTLHQNVISSIEVYSDGETIDSLFDQLSRSPSVYNVRRVMINDHEWIEFDSSSGSFNHGVATVHNNLIYYINGELSRPEFVQKFSF